MKRAIVAFLLLLPSAALATNVKNELQGIRTEIRKKEKLLQKTTKLENKVSTEIADIDRSLKVREADLKRLSQELKVAEKVLSATARDESRARKEAELKQNEIRKRLVSLYKAGDPGMVRVAFSSESLPAMAEMGRYVRSVVQSDRTLAAQYREKMTNLATLKVKLESDTNRKESIKQGIQKKAAEIESDKLRKVTYLSQVRADKKSYQSALRELQANARNLQAMVERLEAKNRKSYTSRPDRTPSESKKVSYVPYEGQGLKGRKGGLAVPVRGDIVSRYGRHKHPEFNSFTVNNGITIAAPSGSDIRAVSDGKVIFSDYFKGYGNMIILDHGDGYFSLYAHASRLMRKEGATVAKSDVIGAVGEVDSTRGSGLYFELRHQGKPIDPAPWFR